MTPNTPRVFTGRVVHRRLAVARHGFRRGLMLACVDVDRLPAELAGLPWWSARRRALIRFRAADYFDGQAADLGPPIRDLVAARIGVRPQGPVHLLTNLRTAGWLFNPLSVYCCWEPDGRLAAVILEVTNTPWGQRHWYALDAREGNRSEVSQQRHVSPFFPLNQRYQINRSTPGQHLDLTIKVVEDEQVVFVAGIAGELAPLTGANSRKTALRHPVMPLQVSGGIYWHAPRLFGKGVFYHRNPEKVPRDPERVHPNPEMAGTRVLTPAVGADCAGDPPGTQGGQR